MASCVKKEKKNILNNQCEEMNKKKKLSESSSRDFARAFA